MDSRFLNKDIQLYQQVEPQIKARDVMALLGLYPHKKQSEVLDAYDSKNVDSFCITFSRRTGKSVLASVLAVTELLVPNASVCLVCPTYQNAKIIFQEVVKHIVKLSLTFGAINNNDMQFSLENGAKFVCSSETSIKSVLGSYYSMVLIDETQSFVNLELILQQYLQPCQLDFGARENGNLYSKTILCGTPRGKSTVFYEYFTKSHTENNWTSFSAKTIDNPVIPASYVLKRRQTMSDILFRQEHEAEWVDVDSSTVFFGYNKSINNVTRESIQEMLDKDAVFIAGIDVGWSDSTAYLVIHVQPNGVYTVVDAYSKNQTSSKDHIANFRKLEDKYNEPKYRFIDPSAAQTIKDWVVNFNFYTVKAKNAIQESINTLNEMFQPSAAGDQPRLYIVDDLKELQRQIESVMWKEGKEDFKSDITKKTHWDLIAALRYAIYSYERYKRQLVS